MEARGFDVRTSLRLAQAAIAGWADTFDPRRLVLDYAGHAEAVVSSNEH